jgi:N-acetylglutamate synthase-like GNAT family acetyltransferase
MKIGQRKYGAATCEIRFAEGVPPAMKHDVRMLTDLRTEDHSQGKGHATELLTRMFAEADRMKVILLLTPEPDENGPMTKAQLVQWYGQLGFQELQPQPLLMARMFKIPAAMVAAHKATQSIIEGIK